MTANSLLKNLPYVKEAIVDSFDFGEDAQQGEPSLVVHVHDYTCDEAFWRSMDFGPVAVRIGAKVRG